MKRIPILVVDKHPQVRVQIGLRLQREADFDVVALTGSGETAIQSAREKRPRVILIDPKLDQDTGLDTLGQLRSDARDSAIVVFSAFTDTAQKIELEKMGVHFIVNKGIASNDLVDILHQAAGTVRKPSAASHTSPHQDR